ncbi:MAG: 1,2-phenylacetyl-CoA epoxidase subunit PaaC [Chitinophagales bacterium]
MNAAKELILKMADDELVIGHRNSEWTGLGPILEEDIAFSSMAQDKVGHSLALYTILQQQFKTPEPDQMAFHRSEKEFRCCHLVELPIGEYDFSLVRHFLFDHAEAIRYELLSTSSFEPLARLARKVKGELKYHVLHANSWMTRLGHGTEESHARIQLTLNFAMPYALGLFEESNEEVELITENIFPGEKQLREYWEERIREQLEKANLSFPEVKNEAIHIGGRKGYHTEHLHPLLEEMAQVFKLEEGVEW